MNLTLVHIGNKWGSFWNINRENYSQVSICYHTLTSMEIYPTWIFLERNWLKWTTRGQCKTVRSTSFKQGNNLGWNKKVSPVACKLNTSASSWCQSFQPVEREYFIVTSSFGYFILHQKSMNNIPIISL